LRRAPGKFLQASSSLRVEWAIDEGDRAVLKSVQVRRRGVASFEPLDDRAAYSLAVNSYMSGGGGIPIWGSKRRRAD
jgi:hypothetical protein